MIWKCQRKNDPVQPGYYHIHEVDAPDQATARVKMYNLSLDPAWTRFDRTDVWTEEEEWTAL